MLVELCKRAKAASYEMAKLTAEEKNSALCRMANALEANAEKILTANKADIEAARHRGLKASLLDRLALDQKKVVGMAKDMREVSTLPDPIGTILGTWKRPNGLIISQDPTLQRIQWGSASSQVTPLFFEADQML